MSHPLGRRTRVFLDGVEIECESIRVEPSFVAALDGDQIVQLSILAKRVRRDHESGIIYIVTKEQPT
jgi:hypothetical protein